MAQSIATAVLDRQVELKANILAFGRIYVYSGPALVAALPLLFLFKNGKAVGSRSIDAH